MVRKRRAALRVADADRYEVAGRLRSAAAEGRLEPDELDERIKAAYAAKTYGDLDPLVKDLPRPKKKPSVAVRPEPGESTPPESVQRYDRSSAVMWGQTRNGVWEIGPEHHSSAVMGGVTLDLREAQFTAPETVIHATAFMGSVTIYVNRWTRVVLEGQEAMGSFTEAKPRVAPQLGPDSPTVRIRGQAVCGSVEVRRRRLPGEIRRKFLGR